MEQPGLSSGKRRTQALSCAAALSSAMNAVFQKKQPLDHFISSFFRANPKFGSRDRRTIGTNLFRVFRDYGYLCQLLPANAKAEDLLSFSAALAGEKEFLPFWETEFSTEKLEKASGQATIGERFSLLAVLAGKDVKYEERKAVPDWVPGYLPFALTEDRIRLLSERPPVWFRLNFPDDARKKEQIRQEFSRKNISLLFHETMKNAFRIAEEKHCNLNEFITWKKGFFEVQDLSSQCIGGCCILSEKDHGSWLDCCAGGGGKTLQIASLQQDHGSIHAWDIRQDKLEELKRRAARCSFRHIHTLSAFPENRTFDGVLVDAPCSGSGRWRRAPEQRWLLTEEDLYCFSETQAAILKRASGCVKKGGILIYATCSLFTEEDAEVVKRFLDGNCDFELESFLSPLTGEKNDGMLSVLPSDGNCDGSFTARFRRK